ncbi:autotransporter outer membrane beta-barrel domain-containing protein [Xenorhabdus eapokensis]|uniref:Autotransporter protein YapK n=1 Tax=Xenorhabdus eapokensis TaxID=1873482 RepID=A0A1Q5TZN6_9GAMM|nr:autotransporter outer membrane beta-barrel domain-containing protein [Xenorhabdus eapokensis]OKP05696.1 autotransporter protein YapK [Xenorhabdus eapokensis]
MKIYRRAVLPMALRVALFFPGISVNAIAAASSCGSSNTATISGNETEPYNLSSCENLIVNKGASINAPKGLAHGFDHYGLKYSAVNVGDNSNLASKNLVDYIENNGTLQGSSGVTVTYTGSVEKLLNHGTISGEASGAVWVSGQINTLDNDGSINASNDSSSLNAIQIQSASGPSDDGKYGFIDTIKNREKGSLCKGMSHCTPSIDGISVETATLKTLDNYGILKSQKNNILSNLATFDINAGGNVGTFNNDGTVTGLYHGVLIRGGGYLENLNNNSGSKGISADQDAVQVTGQGMAQLDVNPQIRSSKIKQITNASFLYGKRNGIYIDDKGVVDTITNLDGGVIKGDKFSIKNSGTITNDIHNSGAIDGNVELGSTRLYMSGPNATLKGNVSGSKNSVVTIGGKSATTGNLDLTYTHDMNIGTVNILSGSTLRLGDGHKTGSVSSNIDNEGNLYFNRNDKAPYNHIISGTGSVHQVGSGITILTNANTYTGETKIESGILQLGDKGTAGSIDNTSKVTIGQGGVLAFDRTAHTPFAADIEGVGSLHQQGTGDLTLTGNVTTGKPITVTSGKLQFGDGATIGTLSLTGIDNNGAVIVAGAANSVVTLDGEINGTGTLEITGGKAVITSDSTYSGQTTISNGATLQLGNGGMTGNLAKSDIVNKGTLALNLNGTSNFDGVISGNGHIEKMGAGVTRLSSDSSAFTGSTRVEKGTLVVDNQLGTKTSTFNVKNGGNVNGTGIIGGTTTLESGGHLTGKQGDTLTFSKDLILSSGANVDISLGAEDASASALFNVRGDLTLAGTLNVTDLGGLAAGEYDIFHYGGTLTDNGMTLTGGKPDSLSLGTNRNHEVHLINTGGMLLNYWDGRDTSKHNNNAIDGGDGIWQVGGNDNWTSKTGYPNTSWKSTDQFAIFSGTAGTVQIDNSGGNVTVNGMQFSADGYKITGNSLTLENDNTGSAKIRVGTGNMSTAGRVATIESSLTGSATLETTDYGTLVLNGKNDYTGGTKVTRGVLQVGDGGNRGSIVGDVVTGSKGTLAFDRSDAVTFGGNITGEGRLAQNGDGTLVLTGTNAHSGGTVIRHGTLQIGDGHNSGTLAGLVESEAGTKLVFNRADQVTFSGALKGQGQLGQAGSGTTVLTGANHYTGITEVQKGTLHQGAEGAFSAASSYTIGQYGTLDIGGFNATVSALNNSGTVLVGGDDKDVGRTLAIAGNYSGNNGTVNLSTVLEGDNSKTDRLVVNGSTSGTTHLVIKNVGGAGAPTNKGIKVVDVKGTSDGTFSLVGDYSYKGEPAVVAGAYAYRLHKNGIDNSDGNWYLRSSLTNPKPDPKPNPDPIPPARLYHAGVSVYEAYGRVLQTLNMPESLHGRIDGRENRLRGVTGFRTTADEGSTDDNKNPLSNGAWGRMTAAYGKLSPRVTTSGAGNITYNMARAQVGIDGRFYENDQGSVVGGGFLQYSKINANVGSEHGEGKIHGNGYTIGATSTWYGNNGFYLDGLTQLTYFNNDLDSKTANQRLGNGKSALGYALGLETGRRFDLTPKWSLTPQAQLVYSSIDMNDFHDTFGTKVRFDQSRNMKLRMGATLDYSQKWYDDQGKNEQAAKIYGLFNIRQELLGRNDAVDVANIAFHGGNDHTWGETGVGGSYNWNDENSFIYGQTSVNTSLNNFADSYELSAKIGLRVMW